MNIPLINLLLRKAVLLSLDPSPPLARQRGDERALFRFSGVTAQVGVSALVLLGFTASAMAVTTPPVEVGKIARLEIQAQGESATQQILRLHGGDARQQVLVNARHDSGLVSDCTRKVTF